MTAHPSGTIVDMETNTTFTFPLHITGDMVGDALRDYSYRIMDEIESGRTPQIHQNIQFLYKFSEPDAFDCACCGNHIGVTLWGEADEHAQWNDIVVMDAEADALSLNCLDCYESLLDEINGGQS